MSIHRKENKIPLTPHLLPSSTFLNIPPPQRPCIFFNLAFTMQSMDTIPIKQMGKKISVTKFVFWSLTYYS